MFRNKELLSLGRMKKMYQKDIERFAFFYLCGKRDRDMLLGNEKMTFSDLERLIYITDFLGLSKMYLEIWEEYGGQFLGQFQNLERIEKETFDIASRDPSEMDLDQHEQWVMDFCRQVPDRQCRTLLKEIIRQICREKQWEDPFGTDIS